MATAGLKWETRCSKGRTSIGPADVVWPAQFRRSLGMDEPTGSAGEGSIECEGKHGDWGSGMEGEGMEKGD